MVTATRPTYHLLPEPDPPPIRYRVVSVDDHVLDPPDTFEGRMPARVADRAPRIVTLSEEREAWQYGVASLVPAGTQAWEYEGRLYPLPGLDVVVGRPSEEWLAEPIRFDEMRPGCFDIRARVADMDLAGVSASLCFPSNFVGFAGRTFATSKDPDLGLACVRAWNQWHLEVWAGTFPGRIIPMQISWLPDPQIAADMIYENAAAGFRAVSFSENPETAGLPSLYTDHWDPFLRACEETETVVCLHTGSSSQLAVPPGTRPVEHTTTLFTVNSEMCAAEWLWSRVPVRFPNIKIALSEGGIGWVPMMLDRLDYLVDHSGRQWRSVWYGTDLRPSEVLRRNFWFCMIDNPSSIGQIDHIGVDHVMVEVDYPHADSTWPDTQRLLDDRIGHLPVTTIDKLTHRNAEDLFRWWGASSI